MMRPLATLLLFLPLAACAREHDLRRAEIEAIDRARSAAIARYAQVRREFEVRNSVPRRLEFPGRGTVVVLECRLEGMPPEEAFWLKYTWINTTDHPVRQARVTLVLRDPASGRSRAEEMLLDPPLGGSFGRESSYTTFARVPLETVPVSGALAWGIEVQVRPPESAR